MFFAYSYMAVTICDHIFATIFLHIVTFPELTKMTHKICMVEWFLLTVSVLLTEKKKKKDIFVLLIAQFVTALFIHTNLNCTILFKYLVCLIYAV